MDTFPIHLFNPAVIKPALSRRTISGGESLSGDTDVISIDGGGRWEVSFGGIELIEDDQVAAWNVWDMHLANGVTQCVVPIALPRQAPLPFIGNEYPEMGELEASSDDPYFPNAEGRAVPSVLATIDEAAALRATELTITIVRGRRLKGSEPFTIVHPTAAERIYRVKRVLSWSDQTAVVQIEPPLREAVAADTPADFDWPRFVARAAPSQDLAPEIEFGTANPVSITFVEAFG